MEWFNKMIEKKIRPNTYSYTTLIRKCGNLNTAISLLKDMKLKRLHPNAVTFGTFLYFAGIEKQKQKELIQEFLQIFVAGKDFGVREFRRLRMHPEPILLFAEEINKTLPQQKELICILLEIILQNPRANDYFKNQAREMKNKINCQR